MLLFYPLDQLRTRLQMERRRKPAGLFADLLWLLQQQDGSRALYSLYQGLTSSMLSQAASHFVYFYAYTGLKNSLLRWRSRGAGSGSGSPNMRKLFLPPSWNLGVASLAGIVNVLATNPLWVASQRLRLATASGPDQPTADSRSGNVNVFGTLVSIVRREGWAALWSGTGASLLLVSVPTLHFVAYDMIKRAFHLHRGCGTIVVRGGGAKPSAASAEF